MSGAVSIVGAAVAAVGAYTAYENGKDQQKTAKRASEQATANARNQAKAADQAANRANQNQANTGAALDSASQAGKSGASGTMLTGPQGVDPSTLSLGKNTLLGS